MKLNNNMKTLILLIVVHFASSEKNCNAEQRNEMHKTFTSCTEQYYQQFETEETNGVEGGPQKLFCELFDHLINDCGDIWKTCHESSEVADMKEMQIQSLYRYYDAFYVDNCDVIKKYKEKPFSRKKKCSEQDQRIAQNLFQKCSHGISSNVYENIQGMSEEYRVIKNLCVAMAKIEKSYCMSTKDSTRILHLHLQEIKDFFDNFMQNIIPEGRFTGCDSFTFQMGENLEDQKEELKGVPTDDAINGQKRSNNELTKVLEVGQYVAKDISKVENAEMPENVEQTCVLSYLETVYNTHLETFDINPEINQVSDDGHSVASNVSNATTPDKVLPENAEKERILLDTGKVPYNQSEKKSDAQVENKFKLQNAASELLNLIQYATKTNENNTIVNMSERSMPNSVSIDSVNDNKEPTSQEEPTFNQMTKENLEKHGTPNKISEKSENTKNIKLHKDEVEEENILEITHNTSIIDESESENITDIKASDINPDTDESRIAKVKNTSGIFVTAEKIVIQEEAKNELYNESKIQTQNTLDEISENLQESENDVTETNKEESESILGNALFKLFQYATQTNEIKSQEVNSQINDTENDPSNKLNVASTVHHELLTKLENSSSISTSLKEEATENAEQIPENSDNLILPGSEEQKVLPIDKKGTKSPQEITNLSDKSEIMDASNDDVNKNGKSVSVVKDNLQIPDAGNEDLARREKINKEELTVEEAENLISTRHPDPEHQFGWTQWKPSDEKLVIPGTGIYPWNQDEKSPTHLKHNDSQERLFPPNSAYSVTLINNVSLILLILVQNFLRAL